MGRTHGANHMEMRNFISEDDYDSLSELSDRVGRGATALQISTDVWDSLIRELPDLPEYIANKSTIALTTQLRKEVAGSSPVVEATKDALLRRSYRPSEGEIEELLKCM